MPWVLMSVGWVSATTTRLCTVWASDITIIYIPPARRALSYVWVATMVPETKDLR
jgi:hypothetical protein